MSSNSTEKSVRCRRAIEISRPITDGRKRRFSTLVRGSLPLSISATMSNRPLSRCLMRATSSCNSRTWSGSEFCPSGSPSIIWGNTVSSRRATASVIWRRAGALSNSTPPLCCSHKPNSEAASRGRACSGAR
ncbi:hypothetical protein D3C85_1184850 [compost metagenome]